MPLSPPLVSKSEAVSMKGRRNGLKDAQPEQVGTRARAHTGSFSYQWQMLNAGPMPLCGFSKFNAYKNGAGEGFKDNGGHHKELILRVQRRLNKFLRAELKVYLVGENQAQSALDFWVKSCHFRNPAPFIK